MLETRWDRIALVVAILAAFLTYWLIVSETIGNMAGGYATKQRYIVALFSFTIGLGMYWGVRWIGKRQTPPIVYVTIATAVSMFYVNSEWNINWYGDDGYVPFGVYIISIFGSALVLFLFACLIEWIGKGKPN